MNIGAGWVNDLTMRAENPGRGMTKTQYDEDSGFEIVRGGVIIQREDPAAQERMEKKRSENERWTDTPVYIIDTDSVKGYTVDMSALDKVRNRLKEEGIDADTRSPTHEVTDEQMEWLNERYDLDYLRKSLINCSEFGNFMLDLAYLNVFSLKEVENFFGVLPFNANCKCISFDDDSSLEKALDDLAEVNNRKYFETEYPGLSESEYEQMVKAVSVQKTTISTIFEAFFARFSQKIENDFNAAKPFIEDASEKLKEDFGDKM